MIEVRPLRAYAEVALGRQRSPVHDSGPHMVPYLRAANVKDGALDLGDVKKMNFEPKEQGVFALKPGDVLVTEGSGSLRAVGAASVWSGEVPGVVCFQNTLLRLRPRPSTDPRFLAWWCRYAFGDGLFASIATGANIFHISAERVRSLPMTYLIPAQQRAIAGYLDTETARIDALIAKKRRLLDLFKHRLDAWRSDAFAGTGRPTGIPSMPEVPESWEVIRNKVFLREINDPSPDGIGEMLSVSHLTGVTPRREKNVNMFEAESTVGYKRVRPGDLVINTMWAWMGAAGVSRYDGIVSPAYGVYRFRSRRVLPEFYDVLVRSQGYVDEMTRFSRGVTSSRLRLYPEEFLALRCPVPHVEVQARLAANYRDRVVQFETLGGQLGHQVELLVEHRQALITAAVTGELEIPGVAA